MTEQTKDTLRERVEEVLTKIRPNLQADGGDVELVDVEDNVAKVRLKGACHGCPMATMTMQMGIGRVIKREVPEILDVENVSDE